MGAVRTLYTDLKLRSADALKGLVAYGRQWQTVDKVVATAAASIERNADRAAAAMARMADGAAGLRAAGGGGGGGFGGGRTGGGRGPDPAVVAARQQRAEQAARRREDANEQRAEVAARRLEEQRQRDASRATAKRSRGGSGDDPLDGIMADAGRSSARAGGLADGAKAIRAATDALGPFATKAERARAAVKDLEQQVARNRKEMADLKAESVRTGDANGTLKGRMQGLAAETLRASTALSRARSELRAIDGGFLRAVKSATLAKVSVVALGTAFGNLITSAVAGTFRGIAGAIGDATKKAIDFESAFADVKKVLPDGTTAEQIKQVEKSVVDLSRKVAVDGPEGAAKLNAALLQTGLYTTETLGAAAEQAAKIGVAFDIGAGEAGDAMAKLRVGGNLTQEQVEALAGTFNHLSNNMPATAKQIVEAETRVISIGNAANISAEQTTALVTAMIATGADADVAATGTKNFIRALGSGEAATKKQIHAFKALGLDARDVAKGLTAGGKSAEATVKQVVSRIGELGKTSREKVLPVLMELFGSESISSIGPLATNIELLTKSFDLAGDSAAAAVSVEKEYEARSKTTANAIQLLKNNVSALAIEFGNALLPYINEVVAFLTSPEGQEWGRGAVEKAVGAVTSLASAVSTVVGVLSGLTDSLGGVAVAVGAVGVAALALTGPFGVAAAAAVAAGYAIAQAFDSSARAMRDMVAQADEIRARETREQIKSMQAEVDADQKGQDEKVANRKQAQDLADRYYRNKAAGVTDEAGRLKAFRQARELQSAVEGGNRTLGGGTEADRLEEFARVVAEAEAGAAPKAGKSGRAGSDRARFDYLSKVVAGGGKLRPSEAAEYTALSKSLDEAKASKRGKGHKQTKMDRQLAAIGGDVRGVLTRGGEADAGGDLRVHDDALSRAVYDRARGGKGGTDRSDGAGIGPGPNIQTWNINTQVALAIDARSTGGVPENIRSAGMEVAGKSGVVFTGVAKLLGQRNAGGVMRGPV